MYAYDNVCETICSYRASLPVNTITLKLLHYLALPFIYMPSLLSLLIQGERKKNSMKTHFFAIPAVNENQNKTKTKGCILVV